MFFVDYSIGLSVFQKKHDSVYRLLRNIYHKSMGLLSSFKIMNNHQTDNPPSLSEMYEIYLHKLGVSEKRTENVPVDVLVIGSDEVFNCLQANPDVGFSPQLFGEGVNAKKVISYAASCGFTTIEGLKKYKKYDEVAGYLTKNFEAISVRDVNSANVVKELTKKAPKIHADPVLTTEFNNWMIEKKDIDNYIIIYSYVGRFSKEEEINAIKKFAA